MRQPRSEGPGRTVAVRKIRGSSVASRGVRGYPCARPAGPSRPVLLSAKATEAAVVSATPATLRYVIPPAVGDPQAAESAQLWHDAVDARVVYIMGEPVSVN